MKDTFSTNSIKGAQVLMYLSRKLLRLYLNFSNGITESTSLIQCLNEGGVTDFQSKRICLRASSVINATAFTWGTVNGSSDGNTPKIATVGSGFTVLSQMEEIASKTLTQKLLSELQDQNMCPNLAGLWPHLGHTGLVPGYILASFSGE